MNVFFYKWTACNENLVIRALKNLGFSVYSFEKRISNYEIDSEIMKEILFICHKNKIGCLFSLDYIPVLASIADVVDIPYICWTQDSPHYPLYSPTRNYKNNYEFVFDKEEFFRLKKLGSTHVFPATLSSTPAFFKDAAITDDSYASEVCFLGTLYDKTDFEKMNFKNEYLAGYVDGLINAQKELYGCNIIEAALTDNMAKEILSLSVDGIPTGYCISNRHAASFVLERKVSNLERISYLRSIGEKYKLTIYTGSSPDESIHATYKGFADYETIMPKIYKNAKINLSFSPRNIHSGVSLRVFDILACNGFLLTNWQPEIDELFNTEKDLVIFDGKDDLLDKIDFYLKHEDLRKKIAQSGYETINNNYTYEKVLSTILKEAGIL